MHKLLFLVTILLLLTFPQIFFLIKKMLIQTHIARFRLHFLRKLRSWLLRKAQQKQKISIMVCCGHTLFECLIAFHVDIRRSIWQSLSIAFVHNLYLVDLLLYTERVFENLQWVKKKFALSLLSVLRNMENWCHFHFRACYFFNSTKWRP